MDETTRILSFQRSILDFSFQFWENRKILLPSTTVGHTMVTNVVVDVDDDDGKEASWV